MSNGSMIVLLGAACGSPAFGPSRSSYAERVPATAALGLVGVLELEALVNERLLPVEHRPREEDEALRVVVDEDAVVIENDIALARRAVGRPGDVHKTPER